MTAIRGILFDKDGTLLDFNGTWLGPYRRAVAYLHARYGDRAAPERLLARGGFIAESQSWRPDSPLASGSNREIVDFWGRVIGRPLDGAARRALGEILTLPADAYAPVMDDLGLLLAGLHRSGIRLGVATMDSESNAHTMLRAIGAEALFDFVCGADSGHGLKPDAGMTRAFCRACGLRSEQVALVGDSPKDMNMGRNAGVGLTVGVLSGAHVEADLAPLADLLLENVAGLKAVLGEVDRAAAESIRPPGNPAPQSPSNKNTLRAARRTP